METPGGGDAVPGSSYASPPIVIHEMNLKHFLDDHRKLRSTRSSDEKLRSTRSSDSLNCDLSYQESGTIALHV